MRSATTVPTLLHNIRKYQSRTSCPSTVTSRATSASSALVVSEREIVGKIQNTLWWPKGRTARKSRRSRVRIASVS
ncbi:hypothetical protein SVIOM342S_02097 [Streptomyces violaceorubidus]